MSGGNTVEQSLDERVRQIETRLDALARPTARRTNFRDLTDANLTKVQDGQVPLFDGATGLWVPGAAGGGRYATKVIACADDVNGIPSLDASGADYVVGPGEDAGAVIQQASDDIAAGDWGSGLIVLLDGQFNCETTPVLGYGIGLAGMGQWGTVLNGDGVPALELSNGQHFIRDLGFLGTVGANIVEVFANDTLVHHCYFSAGVLSVATQSAVIDNYLYQGARIHLDGGTECVVALNRVHNMSAGRTGFVIDGHDNLVHGNLGLRGGSGGGAGSKFIELAGDRNLVTHNIVIDVVNIDVGVDVLAGADDNLVVENVLRNCTTPIADAGSGTLLEWPTGGTYGSNVT